MKADTRLAWVLIVFGLLTIARRLPAPITDVETPTPKPEQSALVKPEQTQKLAGKNKQSPAKRDLKSLPATNVQKPAHNAFDGVWVGTETVTFRTMDPKHHPEFQKKQTKIIIGASGTSVGIIGGICPGRFDYVERQGNSLSFGAYDSKIKVTLSPDGKTLLESGNVDQAVVAYGGHSVAKNTRHLEISGTFHRE